MKIQKIKFISFVAMMLLLVGSSALNAQRQDGPPRGQDGKAEIHQRGPQHQQGEKGPKGPRIPNMTEEQQKQMKAIHLKSEKAALPLKNQVGEKEARLRTLTTSEDYNVNVVNKVIDEIGSLKSNLMKLRVATAQEVKQILTEEQLVFFNNHMGKRPGPVGKTDGPKEGRKR